MFLAYAFGAFAYIGGIGLTVSSGWLITMASTQPPILTLGVAIVLVRFFGIFRSVARYGERLLSHKAVFDQLTALRVQIYSQIVKSPIANSMLINSGSAVKTLVDDVERAQEYQLRIKLPGVSAILALSFGVLLGLWVRPESLILTLPVSIVLLFLVPSLISRYSVPLAIHIESEENKYTQVVEASVQGVVEAQIYGYVDQLTQPSIQAEEKIASIEKKLIVKSTFIAIFTNALIASVIVATPIMIYLISKKTELPPVQVSMLIFLPLVMFEAITSWYPNLFGSGKLLASQQAVDELLESAQSQFAEKQVEKPIRTLACKDVRSSWGKHFMRHVSFNLESGELLVIRGKSGAGKSTLAMALMGLLGYEGSITINEEELSSFTDLNHRIVGTVQRSHIFNTSIRENLKVGNPQAQDEHIMSILKAVELDTLIAQMDRGLDTIIGEFGRTISGGEAKRLAVARVLLADADLYIFDEPTEHLDQEMSLRIEEAIKEILAGKMVIVVTHTGWERSDKTLSMLR